MTDRLKAAWDVLRGTKKAVPMGANWYVFETPASSHPWGYSASTPTTWINPNPWSHA